MRTLIILLTGVCLAATAEKSGSMNLVEPLQLTMSQQRPEQWRTGRIVALRQLLAPNDWGRHYGGAEIVSLVASLDDEAAGQMAPSESVQTVPPQDLLRKGRDEYRARNYNDAARDLHDAAQGFMSSAEMQHYIDTGHYTSLGDFETALIYLSLAYDKMGRGRDAREPILRILAAERVEPHYAALKLEADAADFEALANRVAPAMPLPPNTALAQLRGVTAQPTIPAAPPPSAASGSVSTAMTTAAAAAPMPPPPPVNSASAASPETSAPEVTPQLSTPAPPQSAASSPPIPPPPAATSTATTPASSAPATAVDSKLAVQPTVAEQRAAEQQRVEQEAEQKIAAARADLERKTSERIAAERAASEKAASEKIAAERAAAEKAASDRIASERALSERVADEKIAAARAEAEHAAAERLASERAAVETAANERIAAERAVAEKAANEKVAAARAEADRLAAERIAAEKAAADRAASERIASVQAEERRNLYATLRQAEAFATNGQIDSASSVYLRLLNSPEASRDTLAVVATGLYRTGDFGRAVQAFQRLGIFNRGEEDLRYYYAVSLYESGHYAEAQRELACALPFIEVTDSVARYRAKIEGSAAYVTAGASSGPQGQ